ncbi:hypothetical protein JRC04_28290 [Mycolicibacterium sp. S2-37]|uniref:hypothetical protein n=1 Tax=Mycolicibacterium sp. S2-37 TaxID=2810297 RepID=UPI001A94952B|nr:hypothetical protein [Mycolicibacterium sp. S2-37]MBO0681380.1 hypothetical protein [Mycolicibacterium sp. S2-37]
MSTPRAAAFAGVLFALMFGAALTLIRSALPEGAEPGSQWLNGENHHLRIAALLMPFAAIAFLWFIGVIRDGFGDLEDRFFSTVFLGSGLLFLAMMFTVAGIGAGLEAAGGYLAESAVRTEVVLFGQTVLVTLSKTYALRMAAVFMISLATIWLRTGLMPRFLVVTTYVLALALMVAAEVSMWLTLAFPAWVLVVSALLIARGRFTERRSAARTPGTT